MNKLNVDVELLFKSIKLQVKEALKMFGTYTFADKGPHEVLDIGAIVKNVKQLPIDDVLSLLHAMKDFKGSNSEYVLMVAESITMGLESWDELWDTAEKNNDEILHQLYEGS